MHPILFQSGGLTFYSYGLALAVGFLAAVAVAARRAGPAGLDPKRVQATALVALVAGVAGGRAAYVALNWDYFLAEPLEILRLDHGGLVFYGGFAGGLLGAFLYMRRAGLPVLKTVDLLIPPLALAHAVGRIGCFLNGCCYGTTTSLPWGVAIPPGTLPRHPTQLYESGFLFFLFLVLSRFRHRLTRRPGALLLLYGLLYGSWRFWIEFLRADSPALFWGLTVFQLISLPLALLCGAFLLIRWIRR